MGFCSIQSFRTQCSFYLVVPLSLGLCNSILVFLHLTKRGRKRRYRSSQSYALEINSKTPCEYLKADSSELYKKKKKYHESVSVNLITEMAIKWRLHEGLLRKRNICNVTVCLIM